ALWIASSHARSHRFGSSTDSNGGVLAKMGEPIYLSRTVGARRRTLADYAQSSDVLADRRDPGCTNYIFAGKNRRSEKLGLSFLLAERCESYSVGAIECRISRGGV